MHLRVIKKNYQKKRKKKKKNRTKKETSQSFSTCMIEKEDYLKKQAR